MGTRSGSVDPGILIHLMRAEHASAKDLDDTLNRRSGLLGISGISSDMRDVLEAAGKGNDRAKLAVDIFVHRLRAGIAAMAASLGGVDVIVFTAGIGENAPSVRRDTCAKLSFLGVQLDEKRNSSAKPDADHFSLEIRRSRARDSRARGLVDRARMCASFNSNRPLAANTLVITAGSARVRIQLCVESSEQLLSPHRVPSALTYEELTWILHKP